MLVPNRHGSSDAYRYGFQGQEKDDEIKGEGNSYTAEFWQYDSRLGRRWNMDPVNKPWMSPYHAFSNKPITNTDPDGADDGDYIGQNGEHLGSDGKKDDKVYTADSVTKNKKGLVTSATNSKLLDISYKKFSTIANIIKKEGITNDPKEYLYIAHAANNNAEMSDTSLYAKLMSRYSSVPKAEKVPLGSLNSKTAKFARVGAISAITGEADPTNGATFWDGTDFLAWGLNSPNGTPQNKFEEYNGISIPQTVYDNFLSSQLTKYTKGKVTYYGKKYSIPATVFKDSGNWYADGDFWFSSGTVLGTTSDYRIQATVTAGRSIFWKKVYDPQAKIKKSKKK